MSYLAKILAEEAKPKKQSPLEKSMHVVRSINKLLDREDSLHKTDHHPDVQKAVDLLKKAHDKHSSVINDETEKLLAAPRPTQNFTDTVKENMKSLKTIAGPLKTKKKETRSGNKIWKEEFMNDFVSMTERYKKEGISYAMLSQSDQQESRHSAHASAPERAPENLGVRMEKALEVLKKDKKMEDIMKELSSINSEFRRTLTNKEALELEKKEAALVKKADDREKELGVKIFHGFPYI